MQQISPASSGPLSKDKVRTLCPCGKKIIAKGLCRNCYNYQWKRTKNLLTPRPKILCHCGKKQLAKGLCSKHYSEMKRQEDPERQKKYQQKYQSSMKGHEARSRRRASLYGAEGSHTADELLQLRENTPNCVGCNATFSEKLPATVDHKTPLVRGGTNSLDNLQLLCGPCNSSKGSKTNDEWFATKPC